MKSNPTLATTNKYAVKLGKGPYVLQGALFPIGVFGQWSESMQGFMILDVEHVEKVLYLISILCIKKSICLLL